MIRYDPTTGGRKLKIYLAEDGKTCNGDAMIQFFNYEGGKGGNRGCRGAKEGGIPERGVYFNQRSKGILSLFTKTVSY